MTLGGESLRDVCDTKQPGTGLDLTFDGEPGTNVTVCGVAPVPASTHRGLVNNSQPRSRSAVHRDENFGSYPLLSLHIMTLTLYRREYLMAMILRLNAE